MNSAEQIVNKKDCSNCYIDFCLLKYEMGAGQCTNFIPSGFKNMEFRGGKWYK